MILHKVLYSLALGAYTSAIRVAALVNPKAALFTSGRKDIISKLKLAFANEKRQTIWMHCASLGEFEQGRPVLEALRARYPHLAVLVTFFSPSGYEVRKDYTGADYVFYLPVDTAGNAKDFIDTVRPALCIFVKYDLWYHYLSALHHRKIPALLISAIFQQRQGFFKWYGGLQRAMLSFFTHIFVQDTASKGLLAAIRITRVSVSGDTRFDRVIAATEQRHAGLPIAEKFCSSHRILVAGSTWKEDEQLLHKVLPQLPATWRIVLVPHEIDDSHLEQIERLFPGDIIRWSRAADTGNDDNKRILLVDRVGILSALYSYADVAWIGGGFGKEGVHNVLEAAVYGIPCLYGPIFHQFIEAGELIACGGAFAIQNADDLVNSLKEMEDKHRYERHATAAKDYVYSKQGATQVVTGYVHDSILKDGKGFSA